MWKVIPNWNYEINAIDGSVRNIISKRIIATDVNSSGYLRVSLYSKGLRRRVLLHRLVAEVFIPNSNNLPEVNHIDGNKLNNSVYNLEWCSRIYNERDCRRRQIGKKKYTPFIVIYESGQEELFEFSTTLANRLGVSKRTILNYLSEKSKNFKRFNIRRLYYTCNKSLTTSQK